MTTTPTLTGIDLNVDGTIVVSMLENYDLRILQVGPTHPNYSRVSELVSKFVVPDSDREALAAEILELADLQRVAAESIHQVGGVINGRMTIEDGQVMIDHEPVDPVLERHVLEMIKENGKLRKPKKNKANWKAFAKFVDNLYANVSPHVRMQLLGWIESQQSRGGFTLTEDGHFIGYKACTGTMENPVSIHSGAAYVDNVFHRGQIPNPIGAVVTMKRSDVQDDPEVGCSFGLHVGTWDYAKSFGPILVTVKVNPADVVSVPTECDAQKIRACRYTVLKHAENQEFNTLYADDADWDEDEEANDEEDVCECCQDEDEDGSW